MSNDRKIIILIAAVPLAAILVVYLVSKVKFDLSLSPLEKRLFYFSHESIPKIIQKEPVQVKTVRSPIVTSKIPGKGFPDTPLVSMTPPLSGTDTRVSLIFINKNRKMAVIDGKLLHEGDVFEQHKVAKIEKDKVLLKNKEGEKWLKLE